MTEAGKDDEQKPIEGYPRRVFLKDVSKAALGPPATVLLLSVTAKRARANGESPGSPDSPKDKNSVTFE